MLGAGPVRRRVETAPGRSSRSRLLWFMGPVAFFAVVIAAAVLLSLLL